MPATDELSATDDGLVTVIVEAHRKGFSVKSDFARNNAEYVAMAASLGLITTKVTTSIYSREWRPTAPGYAYVEALDLEESPY